MCRGHSRTRQHIERPRRRFTGESHENVTTVATNRRRQARQIRRLRPSRQADLNLRQTAARIGWRRRAAHAHVDRHKADHRRQNSGAHAARPSKVQCLPYHFKGRCANLSLFNTGFAVDCCTARASVELQQRSCQVTSKMQSSACLQDLAVTLELALVSRSNLACIRALEECLLVV